MRGTSQRGALSHMALLCSCSSSQYERISLLCPPVMEAGCDAVIVVAAPQQIAQMLVQMVLRPLQNNEGEAGMEANRRR